MGKGLRFESLAAMPESLRVKVVAQGKGAPREPAQPRTSKFNNHPTTVDGIRFASKKEARYYEQLLIRQKTGEVSHFLMQVPFRLPGGTKYVLDFLVFFTDAGRPVEHVDVKGKQTKEFRIKKREIEKQYPIEIKLA